ncbi:unnamed protein product [Arctogadus glacialis]
MCQRSEMVGQLRLREETLAEHSPSPWVRAPCPAPNIWTRGDRGARLCQSNGVPSWERERGQPDLRPSTREELEKRTSCPGRNLLVQVLVFRAGAGAQHLHRGQSP